MKGSGLAIWEVIMIARHYYMDVQQMARAYPHPPENIHAAINYYDAYREELDQAIEDNQIRYEAMKNLLSNIRLFEVPEEEINGIAAS